MGMADILKDNKTSVPRPSIRTDGLASYYIQVEDPFALISIADAMKREGMRPSARIWRCSTGVDIVERNKNEVWTIRYYARNEDHANDVLNDVLDIIQHSRKFQMELWI